MSNKSFWLESDGKPTKIAINKVMKVHRINIQQAMAIAMSNTRVRATDRIISNSAMGRTGKIRNPRAASRIQKSTPGRLTSRTGKLKYMLKHGTSAGNPLRGWKGFGNINAKQVSVAFISQIKGVRTGRSTEEYIGTIKVRVRGDATLFSTFAGRPQESLRTLAVRFNWETGIRGGKRQIFKPVSDATNFDMRRLVDLKDANIRRAI